MLGHPNTNPRSDGEPGVVRWPLVTVVVPAYNHQEFVIDCLDSITSEGYPNLEVRIHDDGSDDRTALVIERWLDRYRGDIPIAFDMGPNRGVGHVLNSVLGSSRGEFVTAVASDDYLLPGGIAARVQHALDHGCDAVFGDCIVIEEAGGVIHRSGLTGLYHANKKALITDQLAELITNWAVPGPVLLTRRRSMLGIGGYDARFVQEDWDLYLRLAALGHLCFLDQKVAAYRLHRRNLAFSADFRRRQLEDNVGTLLKARTYLSGRHELLTLIQLLAASVERTNAPLGSRVPRGLARIIRGVSRVVASLSGPR